MRVVVVVLVRQVVVLSQYDGLVFLVIVRCLFVFEATFIRVWVIRTSKVYTIKNKKSNNSY